MAEPASPTSPGCMHVALSRSFACPSSFLCGGSYLEKEVGIKQIFACLSHYPERLRVAAEKPAEE